MLRVYKLYEPCNALRMNPPFRARVTTRHALINSGVFLFCIINWELEFHLTGGYGAMSAICMDLLEHRSESDLITLSQLKAAFSRLALSSSRDVEKSKGHCAQSIHNFIWRCDSKGGGDGTGGGAEGGGNC